MKLKSLITIFCFLSASASGVEVESWNITQDAFIDGKVDSSAESVAIRIKHINNIFNYQGDFIISGELYNENVIKFVMSKPENSEVINYLGSKVGGSYSGTWHSSLGSRGDWLVSIDSDDTLIRNCNDILIQNPGSSDGYYTIDPDTSDTGVEAFEVYCDMTTSGGGWTLFASHKDGSSTNGFTTPVIPSHVGVLSDEQWKALRDTMRTGILVKDDKSKIALVSKEKMDPTNPLNIATPWSIDSLKIKNQTMDIWVSKNPSNNRHSLIRFAGSAYPYYSYAGAALYNEGVVKFDIWPYSSDTGAYNEHNSLDLYLK
ncbi:fibrinogen-like YCDxxxxGGGW domain-containing protein [Shewanella xiamenensis]|uniref:Fibrinogen-like YCDxxxxGGGW domain-containing protein n=1 Tax=Shewanella xiamenensis TaxID=332186 RepID=A0ABT6UFH4_9GAMM|nr:fibrinogen-like YCDxxxxGGGW domain-containing protein [Shewanella xiamenensis]MDI5832788.1 fibrinogen-like YCDxxxxGGGW domain-containing protein [Shewanella xiamenensis]